MGDFSQGYFRALKVLTVAIAAGTFCHSDAAVAQQAAAAPNVVEGLPRQATLGFRTTEAPGGLAVARLEAGSPAAQAGLADGDLIVAVNGANFSKPYVGQGLLARARAGSLTALSISRGGTNRTVRFTPLARPLERIEGVDTRYGSVTLAGGQRLRTLVAHKTGLHGPRAAILFTQWVSCGSLEYRPGSNSLEILARLARNSGAALVRVERAGAGDSPGPMCHELDYDTEVAQYAEAFDLILKADSSLDRERIVVLGSSLGSTVAPLVAQALEQRGHRIAGVAVNGGGAVTYFERMLNFDRAYLERRPAEIQPGAIDAALKQQILFQVEYLLKGRKPEDIVRDNPAMATARAGIRGLGDGEHYGRPYAYHQQAARRNFLEAWTSLKSAQVLVVYGEYDQFESRHGHEVIAQMVNRLRPGAAEFVELARVDHDNEAHPTIESAYAFSDRGVAAPELYLEAVYGWLRSRVGVQPDT